MGERNIKLQVRCNICGGLTTLEVTGDSMNEYYSPNRRHIQDIFPYLSAGERELLISHTCPKCWEEMFGSDEDDDFDDFDDDYMVSPEDLKEWQDASCGRV